MLEHGDRPEEFEHALQPSVSWVPPPIMLSVDHGEDCVEDTAPVTDIDGDDARECEKKDADGGHNELNEKVMGELEVAFFKTDNDCDGDGDGALRQGTQPGRGTETSHCPPGSGGAPRILNSRVTPGFHRDSHNYNQ